MVGGYLQALNLKAARVPLSVKGGSINLQIQVTIRPQTFLLQQIHKRKLHRKF
jgi:hypothetical protein